MSQRWHVVCSDPLSFAVPSPSPLPQLLRRVGMLTFVAATLFLLAGLLQQEVDPENRALKSPTSIDASNLLQLNETVPADPVLLLAFAQRGELDWLPADRAGLAALQARLAALPGVTGCTSPTSPERQLALMLVRLQADDLLAVSRQVVATARENAPPSTQVFATGLPLVEGTIAELVAGERLTVVPALLLVLLLSALAFYRHLGLATAVLLPALAAIAWTGGAVAWLGHRLDPVAALLDPVLLTIGVAASVHFVEAFRRARRDGHATAVAVQRAVADLRTPALMATVTTMIGLWSLTTSATPAVVDFGIRAAFGVALTHLFTFGLLPGWLCLVAGTVSPRTAAATSSAWLRRVFVHRLGLTTAAAAISALALAGLTRVSADNDPLRLLPDTDACRLDHEQLSQRLGGVEVFHLLVPARSPGSDPTRLLPLLAELRLQPGIAGIAGPVLRGAEGDLAVPLLLSPAGSAVRVPLFAKIDTLAHVLGLDGVVAAGKAVQIARDSQRLIDGLLGSLALSFLLLTVTMCIGLRSLRLGLCAMLPNVLPSLWLYGGLGWLDRPVSVATAMIGCTMLGLIVDNTLHLLHHYRQGRVASPPRRALRHAFVHCGRAMTLSSVVLMLGFATAATSRLSTTVEFALLATFTIASAWFGTAVLLPILLQSRRSAPGAAHAV